MQMVMSKKAGRPKTTAMPMRHTADRSVTLSARDPRYVPLMLAQYIVPSNAFLTYLLIYYLGQSKQYAYPVSHG